MRAATLLLLGSLLSSVLSPQATRRISTVPGGPEGDAASWRGVPSADGRWIAFVSDATNLVPGDTNGLADVFLADRETGALELVTRAADGGPADGPSERPAVTPDGRWVAFESRSTNLVAGGTPRLDLVYVRDMRLGETHLVSVSSSGALPDQSSPFLFAAISDDGRHVGFTSPATNLVAGDRNGSSDVFVRDRDPDGDGVFDDAAGGTVRVSVSSAGVEPDRGAFFPKLTPDGRCVTFHSNSRNLVPGDTRGNWDVFLHDRDPDGNGVLDEGNGTTRLVSEGELGRSNADSRDGAPSADGRWVAFWSAAPDLVPDDHNRAGDAFVADLVTRRLVRVSVSSEGREGNGETGAPNLSSSGRFVSFPSQASNLVPDDTNRRQDVFVHDRDPDGNGVFDEGNGTTVRRDVDVLGNEPSRGTDFPKLSADGRWLTFDTVDGSLVPGDGNGVRDVFLRDLMQLAHVPAADPTEPGELVLAGAFGDEGRPVLFVLSLAGFDGVGTSVGGSPPIPLVLDSWSRVSFLHPGSRGGIGPDGGVRLPALRTPPLVPVHAAALILGAGGRVRAVSAPVRYVPGLEPGRGAGAPGLAAGAQ